MTTLPTSFEGLTSDGEALPQLAFDRRHRVDCGDLRTARSCVEPGSTQNTEAEKPRARAESQEFSPHFVSARAKALFEHLGRFWSIVDHITFSGLRHARLKWRCVREHSLFSPCISASAVSTFLVGLIGVAANEVSGHSPASPIRNTTRAIQNWCRMSMIPNPR